MSPVVQDTYTETIDKAVAGMIANMQTSDVDTRTVETATGIPFGVAVSQGAADYGALIGGASADVFAGISVRDIALSPENADVDEYQDNQDMGVLTRGDIWVTTGGVVAAGDDVTFVQATGVLSSAAAGAGQFAIAGARWMTSAGNGELAIVRLSGELPSA